MPEDSAAQLSKTEEMKMRLAGKPKSSESNPSNKESPPSLQQKPKSFGGSKPPTGAVANT